MIIYLMIMLLMMFALRIFFFRENCEEQLIHNWQMLFEYKN